MLRKIEKPCRLRIRCIYQYLKIFNRQGDDMIHQTILPFKLEVTKDTQTSNSGLILFGEFVYGLGLSKLVGKNLPKPGSNSGFEAWTYVYPLLLMLHGGGRSLEDTREIKLDEGLSKVLPLKKVPSSDAFGKWLLRMGRRGGLYGLLRVNRRLLKKAMKRDGIKGYTLDIDATFIKAEKFYANMTYKGFKGYMPIVGHIAENGMVLGDEFREGNDSPAARNLDFIKHCEAQLPKGKKIKYFRSDSAGYQGDIIDYCEDKGIEYAIGAKLDSAVVELINEIPKEQWREYKDGEITEVVHTMNKNKTAFRLIIVSRPYQSDVFGDVDPTKKYTVIATNRTEPAEWVVDWYNQRSDCSENRIKELKIGFSMERMPCGQFEANAVFFRIGVIAYNLYKLFVKNVLDKSWQKFQVQTVRWRLYQKAGKVVSHAGQIALKVNKYQYELFERIRYRSWKFVMG
jgi:hypothetical protein